jgi:hypothetical protein
MGGLHVTSLPDEAAAHADTIFLGPGEDTWPRFLADFRRRCPDPSIARRHARSQTFRRSAVISSSGGFIWCRTPSSFRAAAHTSATSVTRKPSSRTAARSTHRRSMQRSRKSTACRVVTSTFWTITCSAIGDSPAARSRRHGQRQFCLRHGWRQCIGLRSHG